MSKENYYKLLEIDYDVRDADTIKQAIIAKQMKWSSRLTRPDNSLAKKNLALLRQVEGDLADPDVWDRHAQEARELDEHAENKRQKELYERLDTTIAIAAKKGWVEEAEVNSMVEMSELSRSEVESRIQFPIRDTIRKKIEQRAKADTSMSKKIMEECKKLHIEPNHISRVHSLYDFLDLAPTTEPDKLHKVASEMYSDIHNEKDQYIRASKMFLHGQSKDIFNSDKEKKQYDEALSQLRLQQMDQYLPTVSAAKVLYEPVVQKLKEEALSLGDLTSEEADRFIEDYCKANDIDIETAAQTEPITNVERCDVCGLINDEANDYCANCGTDLEVECPRCQTTANSYHHACGKCGFLLGNIPNVPAQLSEAKSYIHRKQYEQAKVVLEDILDWWPTHPEALEDIKEIRKKEQEVKQTQSTIQQLWNQKHFYTLRKLFIDHYHLVQASTSLQSMEKEGLERIRRAESYLKQADNVQEDAKKADLYLKALEVAPDCNKAINMLAQWPPLPPSDLYVSAQSPTVLLEWQASSSKGPIIYRVLRKQGEPSNHFKDGDVLEETTECTFSDVTAIGGHLYYYSVYTLRGEIISEECVSEGPIVRIAEVEQLDIRQENNNIGLTWLKPNGAKAIEVWRKENEAPTRRQDGERINVTIDGELIDDTVTFGKSYGYLVIAIYEIDGKSMYAKGVSRTHKLTSTPQEGPRITTERKADGIMLHWDPWTNSEDNFAIYYAYTPFTNVEKGTIAREDLPDLGQQVVIDETKDYALLQVNMNQTVYLLPVTYNDEVTVINEMIISKDHIEVANVRHSVTNQQVVLKWQWPQEIDEVFVVCREDRFATDPNDATDAVATIDKKTYQQTNGYHLPLGERDYYITIFTTYESNGLQVQSNGITHLFVNTEQLNVTYELKTAMFSRKLRLYIDCKQNMILPELVLVKRANSIPTTRDQGEDVLHIKTQRLDGSLQIDIPPGLMEENTFAKLFFKNEQDAQKIRLQTRQGEESMQLWS